MTLLIKLTMAEAGCSGSNSANMWQTFSATLPGFLATKPNTLRREGVEKEDVRQQVTEKDSKRKELHNLQALV